MTGRCLVIANQTLGGESLDRAIEDCIARDIQSFYVVVPLTRVEHEATTWAGGFGLDEYVWMSGQTRAAMESTMEEDLRRQEAALIEAKDLARQRLHLMVERIAAAGGQATGVVGDEDPVEAARIALEEAAPFDEIVISTLPGRLSRWLKMDLPCRVGRMTDLPITTVEAPG